MLSKRHSSNEEILNAKHTYEIEEEEEEEEREEEEKDLCQPCRLNEQVKKSISVPRSFVTNLERSFVSVEAKLLDLSFIRLTREFFDDNHAYTYDTRIIYVRNLSHIRGLVLFVYLQTDK